jgi:NO-binding membrane sensor protein with MHYT domain
MSESNEDSSVSDRGVPDGYRAGIIIAITVFVGFSLAFLRFWAFEAPGEWTPRAILVTAALVIAIALEIYALFRALRVADHDPREYAQTVAWFMGSAIVLLIGLTLAAVVLSLETGTCT